MSKKSNARKFSFNVTANNSAVISRKAANKDVKASALFFESKEFKELKKARCRVYRNNGGIKAVFVYGFAGVVTILLPGTDNSIRRIYSMADVSPQDALFKTQYTALKSVSLQQRDLLDTCIKQLAARISAAAVDFDADVYGCSILEHLISEMRATEVKELKGRMLYQYALANADKVTIK